MNPHDVKVVPVCLCSVCCFLSIFAVIALPLSFRSLEQGKYALQLSWSTQEIGEKVLTEPGVYMVGLGNMLVEFPSTLQTMYFVANDAGIASGNADPMHPVIRKEPVRARSRDGLEMLVSVSFQWVLRERSLKPLYTILGGGTLEESLYRDEFVRFARSAIIKACAKYAADTFFSKREMIANDLLASMKEAFAKKDIGLDVDIEGLQLREVDVPSDFDEEIIKTQEQMQEVEVASAERAEQRTVMERQLLKAEYDVQKNREKSLAVAAKTFYENEAFVKQLVIFNTKQAAGNAKIVQRFAYDPEPFSRLFEMMELRAYDFRNDTRTIVNIKD